MTNQRHYRRAILYGPYKILRFMMILHSSQSESNLETSGTHYCLTNTSCTNQKILENSRKSEFETKIRRTSRVSNSESDTENLSLSYKCKSSSKNFDDSQFFVLEESESKIQTHNELETDMLNIQTPPTDQDQIILLTFNLCLGWSLYILVNQIPLRL